LSDDAPFAWVISTRAATEAIGIFLVIPPAHKTETDCLETQDMAIRIVRLGSKRAEGEGLRIGTVRRPPRGVPKAEFGTHDYYDVWLPNLSPSASLVTQAKHAQQTGSQAEWNNFARSYRAEMNDSDTSKVLDLLAALSHSTDFSVGCYCEDESRCHRSILRQLLSERGALIK